MAITDLRYAATLLKSGFSASEVRDIIGLSAAPARSTPADPGALPDPEPEPEPDAEPAQEPENVPDPEPEQDPESAPDPEPGPEKQDPRTRRENPKTETLTDALAKLL